MIGLEFSPITTTLGDLRATRTSTNPDFSALIVRWFHSLDLRAGDVIAIGCSGSFPALILTAICAAEAMELKPIIIVSLGASSYGANRPHFTYLDIEQYLFQRGLIHHRSEAATLGGTEDIASDLRDEARQQLLQAIQRNNVYLIHEADPKMNITLRAKIYRRYGTPKVFLTIGGAQINIGDYGDEKRLSSGLNLSYTVSSGNSRSMVDFFSSQKIPIIHLLHIEQIALQNRLDIDPIPLPEAGKSPVYFDVTISPMILSICILLCILSFFWLFVVKKYVTITFKKVSDRH